MKYILFGLCLGIISCGTFEKDSNNEDKGVNRGNINNLHPDDYAEISDVFDKVGQVYEATLINRSQLDSGNSKKAYLNLSKNGRYQVLSYDQDKLDSSFAGWSFSSISKTSSIFETQSSVIQRDASKGESISVEDLQEGERLFVSSYSSYLVIFTMIEVTSISEDQLKLKYKVIEAYQLEKI